MHALAAKTGRSYGWVHNVLREGGVEFRKRGGNTQAPKVAT